MIQHISPKGTNIELAICISICNESYSQFLKTMKCILINIAYLTARFAGMDNKNIIIFLIQDGIDKISLDFIDDANRKIIRKEHFNRIAAETSNGRLVDNHCSFHLKENGMTFSEISDRNFNDLELSRFS